MGDISNELALYANYAILRSDNNLSKESFKHILQGYSPHYYNDKYDYYEMHMTGFFKRMDDVIDKNISKINFLDILFCGFSIKMDAWIVASIIAKKIKEISPQTIIVIGGINTRKNAKAFLESFHQFDIAMWGEGEESIVQLAETLNKNSLDFCEINNIAYREKSIIKYSKSKNINYVDMSENDVYPNYDDFFRQREELNMKGQCIIPIEGSRGCHWNKCKFCYLNEDYKYRVKSVEKIVSEIKYMIKRYGVFCFEFLDNDFIGLDIDRTNQLLSSLVKIKQNEPKFEIVTIEVITKGLNHKIIKKMFDAGVTFVQIGYESTSHRLLNKM